MLPRDPNASQFSARSADEVNVNAAAEDITDVNAGSSFSIDGKRYREIPDPNLPDQEQTTTNIDLRRALAH